MGSSCDVSNLRGRAGASTAERNPSAAVPPSPQQMAVLTRHQCLTKRESRFFTQIVKSTEHVIQREGPKRTDHRGSRQPHAPTGVRGALSRGPSTTKRGGDALGAEDL